MRTPDDFDRLAVVYAALCRRMTDGADHGRGSHHYSRPDRNRLARGERARLPVRCRPSKYERRRQERVKARMLAVFERMNALYRAASGRP